MCNKSPKAHCPPLLWGAAAWRALPRRCLIGGNGLHSDVLGRAEIALKRFIPELKIEKNSGKSTKK
jgi:hypothetical protein